MGIEQIEKSPEKWVELCRKAIKADEARRDFVRDRLRLYHGDYREILETYIRTACDPAIAAQLVLYVPLVGGQNLIKRVSNELGRPLYARDALRRIKLPTDQPPELPEDGKPTLPPPSPAQIAWETLAKEMELDKVMGQVSCLLTPSGRVFLKPRVVDPEDDTPPTMALDLFTADMMTVIANPKRPTKALVYLHCCQILNGKPHKFVAIDNKRTFAFYLNASGEKIHDLQEHDWGLIPMVDIALEEIPGCYWNPHTGEDLKSQTLASMSTQTIIEAKAAQQSHIQLAFKGDIEGFPSGQILGNKSLLSIGGGTDAQLFTLDLQSSPEGLLKKQEQGENTVAGNYGISRARLNQAQGAAAIDDGLQERVAERAQIMYGGEQGVFVVVRALSREHPTATIPADATMVADLGYLHNRTDRKTQLELRAEEVKQGGRSHIDSVLEDNPEYGGDRAVAMAHIQERAVENAAIYEVQRATNGPKDMNAQAPGQTAETNGAMGPAVRDGQMTKDQAAARAMGKKDVHAIALRVLKGGLSA